MRLWIGVKPKELCKNHFLGEHYEIHKIVGAIKKGKNLTGYYEKGWIDTMQLRKRHEDLVRDFIRRGFCHASPLAHFDVTPNGFCRPEINRAELKNRCPKCRELIQGE